MRSSALQSISSSGVLSMPTSLRNWTAKSLIPFGLLIIVASYCYAVSQHTPLTPIQQLEAIIEPYQLKYDVETNKQDRFTISAEQREIQVHANWTEFKVKEDGNGSIGGETLWSISVIGWNADLQEALTSALNESPASANQLLEHSDERIQFLLLKVLAGWGHDVTFRTDAKMLGQRKPWELKPHAVEALLTLARRKDPLTVGTVISSLRSRRRFSTDVFLASMDHSSSDIRVQALLWLRPEAQQLTSAEIQTVAPVLINHLTDRDLSVRSWTMSGLQSLVAHWEQSLGGAPFDIVRTDQTKMTKLPIAPASNRWYHDVSPQASELAEQYQLEWQTWLTKAEGSL
jgi:hypothetical protein